MNFFYFIICIKKNITLHILFHSLLYTIKKKNKKNINKNKTRWRSYLSIFVRVLYATWRRNPYFHNFHLKSPTLKLKKKGSEKSDWNENFEVCRVVTLRYFNHRLFTFSNRSSSFSLCCCAIEYEWTKIFWMKMHLLSFCFYPDQCTRNSVQGRV